MLPIAQLIQVHLDLWPWLTYSANLKVTNEKMAYIFLMVQDEHVVTMKHYWEFDIWLSESAHIFHLRWPWQGYFKATKVKIAPIAIGERWIQACHQTSIFIWSPWPWQRLIWRHESAIPATAGLLVTSRVPHNYLRNGWMAPIDS